MKESGRLVVNRLKMEATGEFLYLELESAEVMQSKQKILIVTPRFPFPVIGGDRLRIFQICKALSRDFDLHLVSLCDSRQELSFDILSQNIFYRVDRIYQPKWASLLRCLFSLFSNIPLQVAYYQNQSFEKLVRKLMADKVAVLCHLIRTAQYGEEANIVNFLEATDAISLNYSRLKNNPSYFFGFRKYIYQFELNKLKKYETNIVKKFDIVSFVSKIDAQYLVPNYSKDKNNIFIFGNGVDSNKIPFKLREQGNDIVFIGNLQSYQNLESVFFFAKEVLPLVRKNNPQIRFVIIGRIKNLDKATLEKIPGVMVTGEVNDVWQYTQSGFVGVCPARVAAGVQNKVLEYMAAGLPVIASSIGLEGIDAIENQHLLIADDPDDIAQKVLCLFNDQDLSSRLALQARQLVVDQYQWSAVLSPIVSLVSNKIM